LAKLKKDVEDLHEEKARKLLEQKDNV